MKKKLSLLLLAVFIIIPVFAFLGCEDVSSYKISVKSSSYGHGTVSGEGTYEENTTVTLKATVTNQNSSFIAWLKSDGCIIKDDPTFQITNNENNGKIVVSTLTFTSNESTRGTYTAVFSESAETMQYVTLDSFRVCDEVYDENGNFITNPTESDDNLYLSIEISQGIDTSNIYTVYTNDLDLNINQKINASTLNTLKLDAQNACPIRISASFHLGSSKTPANFKGELLLAQSSNNVIFQNGYYHMIFSVNTGSANYYFVATYHILVD